MSDAGAGAGGAGAGGEGGAGAGNGAGGAGAGNGAGGAGAGAGAGNGAGAGGGQPWYSSFDSDTQGYIQNKGWTGPKDILTSYQGLEKLRGVPEDRLLKLPEKEDDPAWAGIYDRLGRPKEAKDYDFKMPEKYGDPQMHEWSKKTFHELGLNKKQAAALNEKWNQFQSERIGGYEKTYQETLARQEVELKSKWGNAHDQNVGMAKSAVEALGIKPETIDKLEQAMGFSGVMELFHNIGSKTGEHKFVSGDGGGSGNNVQLTPDAAKNEIARLKQDQEFGKKYIGGDSEARTRMERLHKMAYPETT